MLNSKALEAAKLAATELTLDGGVAVHDYAAGIVTAYLTASMPEDVRELAAFLSPPSTHVQPETVTLAGGIAAKIATALASLSAKVEELTQLLAGVRDDAMRADNDLCAMEARAETAEASLAERDRIIAEMPDPKHFAILVEAMAEVKATSDGLSNQSIAEIVAGCLAEIEALPPRSGRDRRAS